MEPAEIIVRTCWVVFLVYWFINAARVKRTAERQALPERLAYRIPTLLGALSLFWWGRFFGRFDKGFSPTTELAHDIGAAACVAGLAVAIWARRTLAGNWSSNVTFKQDHELIERGPYRFARHPIYTGMLLMCIGKAMVQGRLIAWIGVALMATGFWIKLKQEEALMRRHFPEEYPGYCKRVKALVPFVV